jgi:steroid delta-isomerase-like uncharacterized protein
VSKKLAVSALALGLPVSLLFLILAMSGRKVISRPARVQVDASWGSTGDA